MTTNSLPAKSPPAESIYPTLLDLSSCSLQIYHPNRGRCECRCPHHCDIISLLFGCHNTSVDARIRDSGSERGAGLLLLLSVRSSYGAATCVDVGTMENLWCYGGWMERYLLRALRSRSRVSYLAAIVWYVPRNVNRATNETLDCCYAISVRGGYLR